MEIGSDKEALMACDAEIPTLYDNPFYKNVSDLNVYTIQILLLMKALAYMIGWWTVDQQII